MKDHIIRVSAANGQIRAFAAYTKELVEEARNNHGTSPVATAALGRTMTAAAMMGVMLKGDKDLLTLQINGNGPLKGIIVTADSKANVKGYVYNPYVDIPAKPNGKFDVSGAIGDGMLNVIMDIGLKDPYVGQTKLVSGEIAEDLTYYFASSEQTPSVVALGVLVDKDISVKQAGGFIVQLMPGAEEKVIAKLEENLKQIKSVTSLLEQGKTPEQILEILLYDMDMKILDEVPTKFYCNCTKDRVEKALITVGAKEINDMIKENKPIELNCHFCNKNYDFSVNELKDLLDR